MRMEKNGSDRVLGKKLWIFTSKKKQREDVDIFKRERCVCISYNRVWENCLLYGILLKTLDLTLLQGQ